MSTKIETISIFGKYHQEENRVTAALLQILKVGGTEFIANVISEINDIAFPSSEINITTQHKEKQNTYDGLLECNFSFRVIVESKIKPSAINEAQLDGLLKNASGQNDYILYITPDAEKPEKLPSNEIYWANWEQINKILQSTNPETEPINFLINEFEKYLESLNLLKTDAPDQRVQIAAGRWGEPNAIKYNFYACQNNRPIKESKYLAFYNKGGIHTLFEIIGLPENDFNLSKSEDEDVKKYLKECEPNYKSTDLRQFYKLKLINDNLQIKNTAKNKNGKPTAFTMGVFRYTTKEKIDNATTTDELL
jgi:hypothetical protein